MAGSTMVKLLLALDQGSPRVTGGFGGGLGLYVLGLTSRSETMQLEGLAQTLSPGPGFRVQSSLSMTLSHQSPLWTCALVYEHFPLRPLIFESSHEVLPPIKGI